MVYDTVHVIIADKFLAVGYFDISLARMFAHNLSRAYHMKHLFLRTNLTLHSYRRESLCYLFFLHSTISSGLAPIESAYVRAK